MDASESPAAPRAPAISAVCVDVRELLRRAADGPQSQLTTQIGQYDTTGGTTASSSSAWPRSSKQPRHAAFWAPGSVAAGNYRGPPPLSPADPVILHAILDNPHPSPSSSAAAATFVDRRGEASAAAAATTSTARHRSGRWPSQLPPSTSAAPSQQWGSSSHGRTQRAMVPTGEVPISDRIGGGGGGGASSMANQSLFMPPARTVRRDDETTDLSPAAQQALSSILAQLHTHAAAVLEDQHPDGEARQGGRRTGATQRHLQTLPSLTSVNKNSTASPMQTSKRAAAAVSPPAEVSPEERTTSNATPADAVPPSRSTMTQERRQPLYVHERTGATSTTKATAAADDDAAPLRRTVPPAFRRQLQFTEAAATTRRPKRK